VRAAPTDVISLRDRLASVEQQIRIVGLGEGGLIALSFGNLTPLIAAGAPRWILGLLVTLLIVAGGLLARAWIAVHVAITRLATHSTPSAPDMANRIQDRRDAFRDYKIARRTFLPAIYILVVAGLCYITATWLWVTAADGHSNTQQGHTTASRDVGPAIYLVRDLHSIELESSLTRTWCSVELSHSTCYKQHKRFVLPYCPLPFPRSPT
jgi:hypothetical protein